MCPHCRAFITVNDRVCPYCGETVGQRAVEVRDPAGALGGLIPYSRYVTSLLLLINVGLFVATYLYSREIGEGPALVAFGAMYRPNLSVAHQWWRLVTAGFLHGGLLHVAMNSWVLFGLGAEVEQIYGKPRMIVFYILATIAGFYLSYRFGSGLSIGASAGITGLLGAMVALGVRNKTSMGRAIRNHYLGWAAQILVIGLVVPRIDNYAHVGGFLAGFAAAYIAREPIRGTAASESTWKIAAGLCLALTAFCFFAMYVNFAKTLVPAG